MKKRGSITAKILIMIFLTAALICICITFAGSAMIYMVTEDGIKNEVRYAAHALYNIYDMDYRGEYHMESDALYKGSGALSESDFADKISIVSCDEDVDFTIFWGETRVLTSVTNKDGSFAVGTRADPNVAAKVLGNGLEYYYGRVDVNGQNYAGYYIPIINSDSSAVGMVFAGKPLDLARQNSNKTVRYFISISIGIMLICMIISGVISGRMVTALLDIRTFMDKVAHCRFDETLEQKTVSRDDEVGDIARSAETLKDNLRDLVERDPLTSLLNRRSCRRVIDGIVENGRSYTAAMADIDFFKKINDKYGHACGDMVLKEVSSIISEHMCENGASVSRWGGEEFLIIMPDIGIDKARSILDGLMERIRSSKFSWEDGTVSVTLTMGAAESIDGESVDETVNRADNMLYEGKRSGRNKIII